MCVCVCVCVCVCKLPAREAAGAACMGATAAEVRLFISACVYVYICI